jgi:hypothetical protein
MRSMKRACLFLVAAAALVLPIALDLCVSAVPTGLKADGTDPPAQPIPVPWSLQDTKVLRADGTDPPAPPLPVPWRPAVS